LAVLGLVVGLVVLSMAAAPARAATPTYPMLTATVNGTTIVGVNLTAPYVVSAQGGPAALGNATQPGIWSYNARISTGNVSGAAISPAGGVLVNGSVKLTLSAPTVPETLVITVEITSSAPASFGVKNETQNFSSAPISIVVPYKLVMTLYSTTGTTLAPFNLTVSLDGTSVGQIRVPTIAGRSSYPATFSYVTAGLPSGTHTFTVSLVAQHGLVVFANGAETFSVSFYVSAAAPDYTLYYVGGAIAFVGAIFIWLTLVAARRRGRRRK
jgi:hypothetical protein